MGYCFDTSAFMDGWNRYYPPDVFPGLWTKLEELVDGGDIVSPDEVLKELEKKDDAVHAWARQRPSMFVPLEDEIQRAASGILAAFPRLVGEIKGRNQADPFVIGLASVRGLTVVTAEQDGSDTKPRIPHICSQTGIRSISLLEMIREVGWSFG